ncbi:MAG: hypothetical protein VXV96_15830 [Bdellovibrionota bacterium]|nr:hypothetical protein [Bdellovibrionota bacterium]
MKDERGSALAMGVLFLGIVIGGTFVVMKQSQESSDKASGEIKFLQGKTESKKVFAIAGYLISNNLILCKSTPWSGGQSKNQCKWVGQKAEETYKHDEFGLFKTHALRERRIAPSLGSLALERGLVTYQVVPFMIVANLLLNEILRDCCTFILRL